MIGGADGDGGIPHSEILGRFAEAAIGDDADVLAAARMELVGALGDDAMVDASAIVATFSAIARVADATGIPIDAARVAPPAGLRDQLGIDSFPSNAPRKNPRFGEGFFVCRKIPENQASSFFRLSSKASSSQPNGPLAP